jgi:hypothetical protein
MDEGHRDVRGGHEAESASRARAGVLPAEPRENTSAELEGGERRDPSQVRRDRVAAEGGPGPRRSWNRKPSSARSPSGPETR